MIEVRARVEATVSNKYIEIEIGVLESLFISIYKLTIANPSFFWDTLYFSHP